MSVTDFPRKGDNLPVSFRNSRFPLFPPAYAAALKKERPDIWAKGGNIRGNSQYRILSRIVLQGGIAKTDEERAAMRLREAWAARHFRDHLIAGVVAQIKWFVIGEQGVARMKAVVEQQGRVRRARQSRDN